MFLTNSRCLAIITERRLLGSGSFRIGIEHLEQRALLAGDFAFELAVQIAVGTGSQNLEIADLDNDGDQDLIVLNTKDHDVSVLLNDGSGAFSQTRYPTGWSPFFAAIADLNGDHNLDLAITTDGLSVHLGIGDGTFLPAQLYETFGASSAGVVAGDWDADGDMDLATANQYSGDVSILLGAGDGTFSQARTFATEGRGGTGITAGDFDGDGDLDLATANYFANTGISILLGNGDGTFDFDERYGSGQAQGNDAWDLINTDLNGDGYLDLIVTTTSGPSRLIGNGDGTFEEGLLFFDTWANGARAVDPDPDNPALQPFGLDLGDLNGDGILDLVLANWTSWVPETGEAFGLLSIMLGQMGGEFGDPMPLAAGVWPRSVVVADMDGDNDLDLAASDWKSDQLSVLFNSAPLQFAAGDANRDLQFDQLDIVQVLQAGKYLTGQPTDWSEGDWNGDGVFDQIDIVDALRTDNFLNGLYAANK